MLLKALNWFKALLEGAFSIKKAHNLKKAHRLRDNFSF
jgi:hypothetical protein